MSFRYRKTEAGRAEIRERRHALSRPARNLLLIIDDTKTGDEWVALVAGVSAADLQGLVDAGFVAAGAAAAAPARAAATGAPPATPLMPTGTVDLELDAAPPPPAGVNVEAASFRALYDYLTAQARPRLGLVKGYRAVLDIERSTDVAALRRYAEHFVELVREVQGEADAADVQRELAALR